MNKKRARELGLPFPGTPGPFNAITDVPGVRVGYCTLDQPAGPNGRAVKTGVTALLPRGYQSNPSPVWAGFYALNGNGEMTGTHWIEDGGYFLGPVCITNSHSVGIVHHAAVRWSIDQYAAAWEQHHLWAMPVVAETYDGVLSDINGLHVTEADALFALNNATDGPLTEGNVGGGNGMICYGFKGGTGTASRRLELSGTAHHLGVLVQANHGVREWLSVLGVPVGSAVEIPTIPDTDRERGSIIVVIATDIPMLPHQLRRLAKRAALGLARGGTPGGNNSGDIFLAFSTANPRPLPQLDEANLTAEYLNDEHFDPVYLAAVESIEEAVVNGMLAAEGAPTQKPPGNYCHALDPAELVRIMGTFGRLANG
ncbi:DmpA family aminopeptidase [Pseudomonas aeruginosa]|uniref:DmpA family aminopeptidase n=1 Tax=Pseudomonas aeruginosa TaxID=287 RepID=UPI000937594F|nr:P1 family peptidase [Pseudomonas aeruginosa]MCT5519268.1 P1 family peptidase [Pseudomonas aeruginosa]MEE2515624.1 P1 family peptidase [Pseudomonas aeruginosa]HEJ1327405.1 P1 family peptidase [Pseudomonas aeruginosa]